METRKYESIVIFRPDLPETQLKQELKRFEGILESKGAGTVNVDNWGKKDIAYTVRKNKQGKFVVLNYETADHSAVEALTSILRISDSVIKFQTHKINERVRKFKGNPRRAQRADSFEDDYSDVMEVEY